VFNRRTTFLTAALEAALAVAITFGLLLVGLSLLWVTENNASVDWMAAYRTAADIWLGAHGVAINVAAQTIAGVKTPAFTLSLYPLLLTAGIAALAFRSGQRLATSVQLWPGWVGTALVYGGFSTLIANTSVHQLAAADSARGTFQPVAVYLLVQIAASLFARPASLGVANPPVASERERLRRWIQQRWDGAGWWINVVLPPALRAGTAVVVSLIAVSALSIALSLAFNWVEVIRLYEGLQLSLFGGALLTFGQLAYLPNFVVFGADWFTGAGFAVGTGSLVAPTGTTLGPIPALPIFAAIPPESMAFGLTALAVPIVAAVFATLSIKAHAANMRFEFANPISAALSLGIPVALVAALELFVLNLVAGGGMGPGRLQDVGANIWVASLVIFAEVAVAATAAAFVSTRPEAPDHRVIERAKTPLSRQTNYTTELPVEQRPHSQVSGFEPEG
jgi:hypothetical protein